MTTADQRLAELRAEDPALAQEIERALASLAARSEALADAFAGIIRHLSSLAPAEVTELAESAAALASGGWKSLGLASRYLEIAGMLIPADLYDSARRMASILSGIRQQSVEIAASCLELAAPALSSLEVDRRSLYLDLADLIARQARPDAVRFFEAGERWCELMAGAGLGKVVTAAVAQEPDEPFTLLSEIAAALAGIDEGRRPQFQAAAAEIAAADAGAAAALLKSAPELARRLDGDGIRAFTRRGLDECRGPKQLTSYFSLTSPGARSAIVSLSGGVALAEISGFLAGFAQALCGEEIQLGVTGREWGHIAGTGNRAGRLRRAFIRLPEFLDDFQTRSLNRAAYKIRVARQAGRVEFGSYRFEFGAPGGRLPSTLPARETVRPRALVPIQRFFDLFGTRALIVDLFRIVEDARIECRLAQEYPGLADGLGWLAETEARSVSGPATLQDAFVDGLVLAALGQADQISWPRDRRDIMVCAIGALGMVRDPRTTVQDAAEIAAWLYDVAISIPPLPVHAVILDCLSFAEVEPLSTLPPVPDRHDEEISGTYDGRAPAQHGDFMPELSQALDKLADAPVVGLEDMERLSELLENSVEIEADVADRQELAETIERFADSEQRRTTQEDVPVGDAEPALSYAFYDEWDFRLDDYRAAWCRVGERPAPEGGIEFCEQVLDDNRLLVHEIRRQFELLRPESHQRIRNLDDGPELDLEKAIQFRVDKRAGVGPRARFYERREKVERSVAVSLLVDVSASTGEPVAVSNPTAISDPSDPRELIPERIIDVEREAVVFFIEALEAIGDEYGVYSFSGYGRRNVDFHVIKELGEPLGDAVHRRIDGTDPARATRMGAAIRHAAFKLANHPAKVRLLLILSDGRPEDQGYGEDATDRDYGLLDTRKALAECRTAGIEPFMITIDREGDDYLAPLCGDIGYEVIDRLAALPKRLPELYRHLTG